MAFSANQRLINADQIQSRARECHNNIGKYPDARVTIRLSQEALMSASLDWIALSRNIWIKSSVTVSPA